MPRRGYQQLFELAITSILDRNLPTNVEDIRRKVSEKIGRKVSWNTIKKYLRTLRDSQKIDEIHSGKMEVYKLK